jgi:deoxyribodipyrimidine photo-lyase
MRTLVWFRSDLRATDNTALHHACAESDNGVIGVFVISPGEWRAHDVAPVRVDLMLRSLRELSTTLDRLNIPLIIVEAATPRDVATRIRETIEAHECDAIFYNREYEINERRRDEAIGLALSARGVKVRSFTDQVVLEPGTVLTEGETYFTVYSPFRRAWQRVRERATTVRSLPMPQPQAPMGIKPSPVPGSVAGFESPVAAELWPAGEKHAQQRLARFAASSRIQSYKHDRDFPGIDGTSTLSPYLTIGAISPRQCLHAAAEANDGKYDGGRPGPEQWINELVWREFYHHVMVGFPRVCMGRAFKPITEKLKWRDSAADFQAWKDGRTGYPIVDAAMRQLRGMGWMHNRLRMIAAMFLTKDLFIDWRLGEKYFMQHLVDGSLASNNGGWQWSASTGTDAQPYFRIFNPYSQSEKFDPSGDFIRTWVPELRGVQGEAIHDPSQLPALLRGKLDYPPPIVDHAAARERVLNAFQAINALPPAEVAARSGGVARG